MSKLSRKTKHRAETYPGSKYLCYHIYMYHVYFYEYYICVFDDQRVSQTAKGNKVTCEVFRLAMHMSTSIITYLKSRHIRLASVHMYLILYT